MHTHSTHSTHHVRTGKRQEKKKIASHAAGKSVADSNNANHDDDDADGPCPIPGFYFDKEKNRYFKGSRPKSKSTTPAHPCEGGTTAPATGAVGGVATGNLALNLINRQRRHVPRWRTVEHVLKCWARTSVQVMPGWSTASSTVTDFCVSPSGSQVVTIVDEKAMHLMKVRKDTIKMQKGGEGDVCIEEQANTVVQCQAAITAAKWKPASEDTFAVTLLGSESVSGCISIYKVVEGSAFQHEHVWSLARSSFWTFEWDPTKDTHLTVGSDKRLLLVDVAGPRLTNYRSIPSYSDVFSVEYLPLSQVLLSGCRDGSVRLYDTRTSCKMKRSQASAELLHASSVCCIQALTTHTVLAADMSGGLKLWDLRNRQCVQIYKGHRNSYTHLQFSVDASSGLLCAAGEDGTP